MIHIKPYNEVYVKIDCDPDIAYHLKDLFTFKINNWKYHPLVKAKKWNGEICLFNARSKTLYKGLIHYVASLAQTHGYEVKISREVLPTAEFTVDDATDFVSSLKLPERFEVRDYQLEALVSCINKDRQLCIVPTGGGKSMIIYWLFRYYKQKTLLIVNTINLLNQMYSDLEEYGLDVDKYVHLIKGGSDKNTNKPLVISTYQSAAKQPAEWFKQFGLVIGDEAHLYTAKSLKNIMENLTDCKFRFGVTGTLDGSQSNQMVLEGLFGSYKKIISTKELIDQDYLSDLSIKCLVLQYPDEEKKLVAKNHTKYQSEIEYIYSHEKRNRFIKNLATALKGNTVIMFQRVEQHGVPLYTLIKDEATVPTYFVAGSVEGEEREEIRKIVNTHKDSITVASVGTFSLGVNIPNINNIIVASPSKSQVRVFQTIGRGLRKSETKYHCVLYDIVDDLHWKSRVNYTLRHFKDRLEMYCEESFDYTIHNIPF